MSEAATSIVERPAHDEARYICPLSVAPNPPRAPLGWRWVKLMSVAKLESGHTPSRYHPEYWNGSIPWISLADIRALDGKVAWNTQETVNEEGIANSSARILPAETVVLSRTATVGLVTIMGKPMATSQDFVNWICGPELHPPFLALLFRASREYFRSLASGAIHQTVYMPTVKALRVCIPDLDVQKEVANLLASELQAAERGCMAVSDLLEATKALPAAFLREFFENEQSRKWPVHAMGEVGEITSGITLGRNLDGKETLTRPYLRVANVKDGHLDLSSVFTTAVTEVEIAKLKLRKGDLMLTEGGDADKVGRGTVWNEEIADCLHQNHIFRVRFDREAVVPEFASYQVGSSYGKRYFFAHAKQTTGIATINRRVLAAFPLMVPPLRVQAEIVQSVARQFRYAGELSDVALRHADAIECLPSAILRRAFGGRL